MYRGTTPTLEFVLPFSADTLATLYITIAQHGSTVIEKTLTDCTASGETLTVTLTQAETLMLRCHDTAQIQVRAKTMAGEALASNIITERVEHILKDGEI